MDRRSFLRRVAAGTAATLVVSALPTFATPALQAKAREACLVRLTRMWNGHFAGKRGPLYTLDFQVGTEFLAALESELLVCQRYVDTRGGAYALAFKTGRVRADPSLHPWDAQIVRAA